VNDSNHITSQTVDIDIEGSLIQLCMTVAEWHSSRQWKSVDLSEAI
jgi:hypothetical protein